MSRSCALLVCVLLAGCSSKKEEPAGTYRNEKFGFSIVPPPGWALVTADTAAEFVRTHWKGLTNTTQEAMLSPVNGRTTWVVAWVKTDSKDSKFPVLWVTHNSVGLPQVGEAELNQSKAALQQKIRASGWRDFQQESAQVIRTDDRPAISLGYSGTNDGTYLRVSEVMVPSKTMTHFIAMSAEIKDWAELDRLYGTALFSFRSFGQR